MFCIASGSTSFLVDDLIAEHFLPFLTPDAFFPFFNFFAFVVDDLSFFPFVIEPEDELLFFSAEKNNVLSESLCDLCLFTRLDVRLRNFVIGECVIPVFPRLTPVFPRLLRFATIFR